MLKYFPNSYRINFLYLLYFFFKYIHLRYMRLVNFKCGYMSISSIYHSFRFSILVHEIYDFNLGSSIIACTVCIVLWISHKNILSYSTFSLQLFFHNIFICAFRSLRIKWYHIAYTISKAILLRIKNNDELHKIENVIIFSLIMFLQFEIKIEYKKKDLTIHHCIYFLFK